MRTSDLRGFAYAQRNGRARQILYGAAEEIDRLRKLVGGESLYALRRTDGDAIGGEYLFFVVDGPNDWTPAEELEWPYAPDPVECEIVRFYVEPLSRRTQPPPWDGDTCCLACWRDDYQDASSWPMPVIRCPECNATDCPRATAHVNRCARSASGEDER